MSGTGKKPVFDFNDIRETVRSHRDDDALFVSSCRMDDLMTFLSHPYLPARLSTYKILNLQHWTNRASLSL